MIRKLQELGSIVECILTKSSLEFVNQITFEKNNLINFSFDQETSSENNKPPRNVDEYTVNKKLLSDDIKMMHEFIEFKYFKKVMKLNNNIVE